MAAVEHLGLARNVAEVAILTGDPRRVPLIGEYFGAIHVTDRRGFVCHVASDWHRPVAIVATGIGGPATAIVAEELIELGVRCLIRIGTCGALQSQIYPDDLIVSTGSVREEGTSRAYVDVSYPAVPHLELTGELLRAARTGYARVHAGITHCMDAYYSEIAGKNLDPEAGARRWSAWRSAGVLATEMEAAALFVIASLRAIPAAAIFVNVGAQPSANFAVALASAVQASATAMRWVAEVGILDAVTPKGATSDASFLSGPIASKQ